VTDRQKVVLVEPDAGVGAWWEAALSEEGWDVAVVSDPEVGFQLIRRTRPAAVVMRARANGGMSFRLLKRLRSSPHTALTPVAILHDQGDDQTDDFDRWGGHVVSGHPVLPAAVSTVLRAQATPPSYPLAPSEIIGDPARLAVLANTRLLDSSPEAVFDQVTRLAARLLDVPTVLMSLVDRDRQFFKSHVGLKAPFDEARETPLTLSFCQWVVADHEEVIVPDAREHPLFKLNAATAPEGVVAYAGVPLCAGTTQAIGSFCAMDQKPRRWGAGDLDALHDAAHVVEGITAVRLAANVGSQEAGEFVLTAQAVGRAIAGATRLITRHESRISEAEHAALITIVGELGRQLAELRGPGA